MKSGTIISLVILSLFLSINLRGQQASYIVSKTSFCSDNFNEFAPVAFRNGIVFCTNQSSGMTEYSTSANQSFFKIYFVDSTQNGQWHSPKPFSKNLRSRLNDGPVAFSATGDTIFYTRNILSDDKLKDISPARNKLGLFSAVAKGNKWTSVNEFKYNNKFFNLGYNVMTPAFSNDGRRLYFASDKPGGYGGFDLYYCQWQNGDWQEPVNLGPVINTSGNELYPFINAFGELIFSSDGHDGFGGKDIYLTVLTDSIWSEPVGFDPPVNSTADDFGMSVDVLMHKGYFSSDRAKSLDIYEFKTELPQIFHTEIQKENQFCFFFEDDGSIEIDTALLGFRWNYGDNTSANGASTNHCFKQAGKYKVSLDIVDRNSGRPLFNKLNIDIELKQPLQTYINSPDYALSNTQVAFDGLGSSFAGLKIISYSWDFGDGNRYVGERIIHSFSNPGEYKVELEIIARDEHNGKVYKRGISKTIRIFDNPSFLDDHIDKLNGEKVVYAELADMSNVTVAKHPTVAPEDYQNILYAVEVLRSKDRLDISDPFFSKIPGNYFIKEVINKEDNTYSYIVHQQIGIMLAYPVLTEMVSLGYNQSLVKAIMTDNPAEKDLFDIIRVYGSFSDLYFDRNDRLTTNAYIVLEKIIKLMKTYPSLRLEVAVHTDILAKPTPGLAQVLTQQRAQSVVNYLISRGISSDRLLASGFGSKKPVASDFLEKDRKLNRRVEFNIIGE